MKKITTLIMLALALQSFGQHIIDREVGEFNKIKVFDLIAVNLIQAEENRIIIKGEDAADIKWQNKDGVLKLRMQLDKKFTGEDTLIEVYYTNLEVIDANEGSRITCNELVKKNKIQLKAQEGARIRIGMDVAVAEIRAVTGGIVQASGMAEDQTVVINTGGVFEGSNLRTANADVKISAGGEAEVYASERVNIDIKAGGDCMVYGQPKYVNKKTFVGGRVEIVD